MARLRSPGYPNASLNDVVEFARRIHEKDRQHPVSREVAAQHMGFSGITGSSDRALSALLHFGLAEKVVKGEIRVSDTALRILHSHSLDERREALREAAFNPSLFQELRDRYPGEPPSQSGLASYLTRSNFSPGAILPAAKAYLETCYHLQREGAYESDPSGEEARAESDLASRREEPLSMNVQPLLSVAGAPSVRPSHDELTLNEPNLDIRGGTVRVEALLDYEGLSQLEEHLKALKMLLKPRKIVKISSDVEAKGDDDTDLDDILR